MGADDAWQIYDAMLETDPILPHSVYPADDSDAADGERCEPDDDSPGLEHYSAAISGTERLGDYEVCVTAVQVESEADPHAVLWNLDQVSLLIEASAAESAALHQMDVDAPVIGPDQGDVSELLDIEQTVRKRCCTKRCLETLDLEELARFRAQLRELSQSEKHLFLTGVLFCTTSFGGDETDDVRNTKFPFVRGVTLCRDCFLVAFGISKNLLYGVRNHIAASGVSVRHHRLIGRPGTCRLSDAAVEKVKRFILTKAEAFGLPSPFTESGVTRQLPRIYLPARTEKMSIRKDYKKSFSDEPVDSEKLVSLSSFKYIWLRDLAHIRIRNPRSDLCNTCDQLINSLGNGKRDELSKVDKTTELNAHLELVRKERECYRSVINDARTALYASVARGDSSGPIAVYSFDFSQSVMVPHYPDQAGPIYFKVPIRTHIFGIVDEVRFGAAFLVSDETQTIGENGGCSHGPDVVIRI